MRAAVIQGCKCTRASPLSFSKSSSKRSYCRARIQPQLIMQMSGTTYCLQLSVISPQMKKDPGPVNPQWLWNLLHNKHLVQILVVESDLILTRGSVIYEHKKNRLWSNLKRSSEPVSWPRAGSPLAPSCCRDACSTCSEKPFMAETPQLPSAIHPRIPAGRKSSLKSSQNFPCHHSN